MMKYIPYIFGVSFVAILAFWMSGSSGIATSFGAFLFGMAYIGVDTMLSTPRRLMVFAITPNAAPFFIAWTFSSIVLVLWAAFMVYYPFNGVALTIWTVTLFASFGFFIWKIRSILKTSDWGQFLNAAKTEILNAVQSAQAQAKTVGDGK